MVEEVIFKTLYNSERIFSGRQGRINNEKEERNKR